jgi:hypothetical protein
MRMAVLVQPSDVEGAILEGASGGVIADRAGPL